MAFDRRRLIRVIRRVGVDLDVYIENERAKRSYEKAGFRVDWLRVDTGEAMRHALETRTWDVVIADYTMPGFSGTSALSMVRDRGLEVPFIFVSGTIGEEIAVDAMKNGADDYIIKPFEQNELVINVSNALRRRSLEIENRRHREKLEGLVKERTAASRSRRDSSPTCRWRSGSAGG